jgi:hypothetical protein
LQSARLVAAVADLGSSDGIQNIVLIESWHPVTKDLGLLKAPVAKVVTAFTKWHADLKIYYSKRESHSLEAALTRLAPLSVEKRRVLFLSTTSHWTAFLQSGIDGSDPFPVVSQLSGKLGVLAMRVCATPERAKWPAVIWEVYAPPALGGQPPNHYRRSVAAANDGGRWVFSQSGAPYPFEDLSAYRHPKTRDRFTREMLEGYLLQFQLRPFTDDFYVVSSSRPAVMLERVSRWEDAPPEFTLEEVISEEPWRRR